MKERSKRILKLLKRPRYFIPTAIGLVIVLIIIGKLTAGKKQTYQLQAVVKGDVVQTVEATGLVKPAKAVDLGFESGGKITTLNAVVGDKVESGTLLATIQNGDVAANVQSAQAKLSALLRGARSEDLAVTEASVASAQRDASTAASSLADAIKSASITLDDAVRNHVDKLYGNPTVSATFGATVVQNGINYFIGANDPVTADRLHTERIDIQKILDGWKNPIDTSDMSAAADKSLLSMQKVQDFLTDVANVVNNLSSNDATTNTVYTTFKTDISAARTSGITAISNLRASYKAYTSAQSALAVAQKQQDLKQAPAANEDVQIARAAVQSASSAYSRTVIRAPFTGLITKVSPEVGEIVAPSTIVISMISDGMFEVEVNIPESDLPKVVLGADADITFDAYGKDFVTTARVTSIDPAATVLDGVPTYRTVLSFSGNDPRIKSGMTANITIHGMRKNDVIVVPQRAVITKNDQKFVKVERNGKVEDVPVTTGLRGSNGNIEITNGLNVGEQIIPSPTTN